MVDVSIGSPDAVEVASFCWPDLPDKDWPILGGAIAAEATHLITEDVKHFGRYFGKQIHGILVLPPEDVEHAIREVRAGK